MHIRIDYIPGSLEVMSAQWFAGAKSVANALTESRAAPTFDFTDDRQQGDGIFLRIVLSS